MPHEGDWKMRIDALPAALADETAAVPGVGALLLVLLAGVAIAVRARRNG